MKAYSLHFWRDAKYWALFMNANFNSQCSLAEILLAKVHAWTRFSMWAWHIVCDIDFFVALNAVDFSENALNLAQ